MQVTGKDALALSQALKGYSSRRSEEFIGLKKEKLEGTGMLTGTC
jgi:hypothetical protein